MKLDHGVLGQADQDVVEVATMVVDDGPTKTPARQLVGLGESTSANDRHSAR